MLKPMLSFADKEDRFFDALWQTCTPTDPLPNGEYRGWVRAINTTDNVVGLWSATATLIRIQA